jgi:hypothetical protein
VDPVPDPLLFLFFPVSAGNRRIIREFSDVGLLKERKRQTLASWRIAFRDVSIGRVQGSTRPLSAGRTDHFPVLVNSNGAMR